MRTSLHGVDQSGPSTAVDQVNEKANRGHVFFDETNARSLVFDGDRRMLLPVGGGAYWSVASPRLIVDHFTDPTINGSYSLAKGNDADAANFAVVSGLPSVVRATTGNAGTGVAADSVAIAGPLAFKVADLTRPMRMAGRIKLSAVTNVMVFIGFTDVLPETTLELPIELTATGVTTNATDAVGLVFDTTSTLKVFKSASVANDVDGTLVASTVAPAADAYVDILIEVATDGTAKTYVNSVLVGTHIIRTSVMLCPIVVACARATATRTVTIDLLGAC